MKSATLEAYYRAELLYTQVQEILRVDDHESQDETALKLADLLLSIAQVDRILRKDNDGGGVLGVSSPLLHRATGLSDDRAVQFHREASRHVLLPRIEDKLRIKCSDVCDVVLPELIDRSAASSSPSLANAPLARQVMEMPALIVELQSLKHQRESRIEELKKQLHQQLLDDLARIKAIAATVQKLLVQYKQHDAPRVLHAKVQWLVACSRAMGVRANVLAKQVLVETYTSDRIALLSRVYEALEERRRRALEEREQLEAKLHLYRSADPEYQAIAREYAFVLQGIAEKKKWIQSLNL